MGITKFSDLTLAEFKAKHLKPNSSKRSTAARLAARNSTATQSSRIAAATTASALPTCNIDWRKPALNRLKRNVITPVKDQGECGATHALLPRPASRGRAGLATAWNVVQTGDTPGFVSFRRCRVYGIGGSCIK